MPSSLTLLGLGERLDLRRGEHKDANQLEELVDVLFLVTSELSLLQRVQSLGEQLLEVFEPSQLEELAQPLFCGGTLLVPHQNSLDDL